jgi:glycerophosphoryl diester phosphodiesterase
MDFLFRNYSNKLYSSNPFLGLEPPIIMAHRGGQGLYPPNTIYAYQRSVTMGIKVLELDIQITSDDVIVVRHDPTVDATTNGTGAIDTMILEEIKSLDAGYRWTSDGGNSFPYRGQNITIPTLEEVLQNFPDTRLNIDIKPVNSKVVPIFLDLLRKYKVLEYVMVGSFHDHQLAAFRKLCPDVATAAGVAETRLFFALNKLSSTRLFSSKARAFQIPEYAGKLHIVTPNFIRNAHKQNLQVHVWTVNSDQEMMRLIDWGVDGIITDYPDLALDLFLK